MLLAVRFHRDKKGGCFGIERERFTLQAVSQFGGTAGGQQALVCQRSLQDIEQQSHPFADIGLTHTEELPMHLLDGILFEIGQNEE